MSRIAPLAASVLVSFLIAGCITEVVLRGFSKETSQGSTFRGSVLLPKDWDALRAHMTEVWRNRARDLSYIVYDPQTGWSIGPNRESADGRYRSGPEGLRTSEVGQSFAAVPRRPIVAVMGDSFAFGEQVDNPDTLASKMQERLGSDYLVLNFGVPGFGVDQSYLRYVHHAMPWQPDVAVLTFIWHDLFRTLSVYTAIAFPHWDLPFSKPRFVLTEAGLQQLNTPTSKPEDVFATPRIQDLPLIDQAIGYREDEWREQWRHYPYVVRFALTQIARLPNQRAHRPFRVPSPDPSDEDGALFALNRAILAEFVGRARAAGSRPVIVYLPSRNEFRLARSVGQEFIAGSGLEIFDGTPCLADLKERAFVVDDPHYGPEGNAAMAECIVRLIRDDAGAAPAG